jgi:hypothetical protein
VDKRLDFYSAVMCILLDSVVEIAAYRTALGSFLVGNFDRTQHHRTFTNLSTTGHSNDLLKEILGEDTSCQLV